MSILRPLTRGPSPLSGTLNGLSQPEASLPIPFPPSELRYFDSLRPLRFRFFFYGPALRFFFSPGLPTTPPRRSSVLLPPDLPFFARLDS